jgi:hypothetical protein
MKNKKLHDPLGRKLALPGVLVGQMPAQAKAPAKSAEPKRRSHFEMAFLAERGCLSERTDSRKIA